MSYGVVARKITAAELFNCADLSLFVASIVQVLPFTGQSDAYLFICELDGIRFLVKMVFYRKSEPEIYDRLPRGVMHQIDAEIQIMQVLRDTIIARRVTPCLIDLVYYKICDNLDGVTPHASVCEKLSITRRSYAADETIDRALCENANHVANGLAYNRCAFLVMDKCDITLSAYIDKSLNTPVSLSIFKSLMFQIVYTVYALNKIYPGFRHYDLHIDNVMLKFDQSYKFRLTNPKFLIYKVNGEQYAVPYFGILPKIIDFGFSVLPEKGITSDFVADRRHRPSRTEHDLILLFYWIYTMASKNETKADKVDKLLQYLEPNRTYVHHNANYIRKIFNIIPTYEDMVQNKVWDEYKKYKPEKSQIYEEYTPAEEIVLENVDPPVIKHNSKKK